MNNGGGTFNATLESANLKKGMVSKYGFEFTTDDIDEAIDKMVEYTALATDTLYIGCWFNDGLYYIDLSRCINKKQDALKFGRANKQLAVWDNHNAVSIELDYQLTWYNVSKVVFGYDMDETNIHDFNTLDEVATYLNTTTNNIKHSIATSGIVGGCFKVYRNIDSIRELV